MNVLIIAASLDEKSGWGRHARAIAAQLRAERIEVALYAPATNSFLRSAREVREAARGCDVVHAMDGWPLALWGYGAVLLRTKKLFINGVGTYSVAPLHSFWKRPLVRLAIRGAQKVFCISAYTQRLMRE